MVKDKIKHRLFIHPDERYFNIIKHVKKEMDTFNEDSLWPDIFYAYYPLTCNWDCSEIYNIVLPAKYSQKTKNLLHMFHNFPEKLAKIDSALLKPKILTVRTIVDVERGYTGAGLIMLHTDNGVDDLLPNHFFEISECKEEEGRKLVYSLQKDKNFKNNLIDLASFKHVNSRWRVLDRVRSDLDKLRETPPYCLFDTVNLL